MSFDGVFIRHLCRELESTVKGARINRVSCIDRMTFILELSRGENLLLSLGGEGEHFRLIRADYTPSGMTFPSSALRSTSRRNHQRLPANRKRPIVVFEVEKAGYLGYWENFRLIAECSGGTPTSSTAADGIVIDCRGKPTSLTTMTSASWSRRPPIKSPPRTRRASTPSRPKKFSRKTPTRASQICVSGRLPIGAT